MQQSLLSLAQQSLPNWPNIYKFAASTNTDAKKPKAKKSIKKAKASAVAKKLKAGYQVGYVFTYLGMYTYLFQKLGM